MTATRTQHEWTCPATVERVHDGDTIVATIDLGYHVQIVSAVRLEGVAAAELHGAHRHEAIKAWEALEALLPVGAAISVTSHKLLGAFEKYGRVLATVKTGDGLDVAEELVRQGVVRRWNGAGRQPS